VAFKQTELAETLIGLPEDGGGTTCSIAKPAISTPALAPALIDKKSTIKKKQYFFFMIVGSKWYHIIS
jgi:hypothetical protein